VSHPDSNFSNTHETSVGADYEHEQIYLPTSLATYW
jgi:hypothetical protein